MQEVMAHHFRVSDRFNELFLILYPDLEAEACDAGAVQSPRGTPEAADSEVVGHDLLHFSPPSC